MTTRRSSSSAATTWQSPARSPTPPSSSSMTAAATAASAPRPPPPGCSPGTYPDAPITPGTLGQRLRTLGIYAQTGRRAALLDLAAQLPAAVLVDLLGLHHNTDARWMHQAEGDWTRYAAELARHPHQP
jgi:hypothetical protein